MANTGLVDVIISVFYLFSWKFHRYNHILSACLLVRQIIIFIILRRIFLFVHFYFSFLLIFVQWSFGFSTWICWRWFPICLSIYFSLCVLVSSCMFCPVFVIGCVVFCFLTIYIYSLSKRPTNPLGIAEGEKRINGLTVWLNRFRVSPLLSNNTTQVIFLSYATKISHDFLFLIKCFTPTSSLLTTPYKFICWYARNVQVPMIHKIH